MKITNEFRARVFNTYIGTTVKTDSGFILPTLWHITRHPESKVACVHYIDENNYPQFFWIENCQLILSPLSAITDEDAIEVAKLYPWFNWYGDTVLEVFVNQFGEKVVSNSKRIGKYETVCLKFKEPTEIELNRKQTDYLRSRSYDCGFMEIPSLIESGIAILK